MIRVFFEKQGHLPAFVCDVCKKRIESGKGIYVYLPDEESSEVVTVCKGECDRKVKSQAGRTYWGEIPALLGFLIHNSGTTHEEVKSDMDFNDRVR